MVLAADTLPAAPVLALMAFGVIIAIGGHLYGSRGAVATGIAILFLATAAMVIGGYVAFTRDESDPRPQEDRQKPF